MADERSLPTSLGSSFSSNLSAMATSAAQSNPGQTAIRGGHGAGMANSQLVQALGHDYSSLRPPFLGTAATANQNELAAQNLVQQIFQAHQAQAQAQAHQAQAGSNMAAAAVAQNLQGSIHGLGMNPNVQQQQQHQHHALNTAGGGGLGMGSGLLSAAAAAAAAGLGLNMNPGAGSPGGAAGLQHMYGLMGGLGMGLGQQHHPALHMQQQQQQQQQQHQQTMVSPGGFSPFGLPPMLSGIDYQHEMLPPDLLAASHLISALPHHELPMQADVSSTDGSEKCPNMSWLDAAELVLREAKHPMHLQDIKQRILEKGLVAPSARSSLEAVIYRDTQRGSRRFRRVDGEIGVFRLITPEEKEDMLRKKRRAAAAKRKSAAARNIAVAKAKRYKEKYFNLRKLIKMMIFENAAMCDEVARTEDKVLHAKEERRFLLQRLLHYQSLADASALSGEGSMGVGSRRKHNDPHGSRRDDRRGKSKHKHKKAKKSDRDKDRQKMKDRERSKRKKRRSSSSAVKRLTQPVPLDPTGKPIFPIILGSLTVHSLGEIISERSGYHDTSHIFPVGYCSSRSFASIHTLGKQCLYTCKILDGGLEPKFVISCEENADNPLEGATATECHNQLIKAVNKLYKEDLIPTSFSGWGSEFFGFAHPTIQNLIQGGLGSRKCVMYKWVKFEAAKSLDKSVILRWHEDNVNVSYEAFQRKWKSMTVPTTSASPELSTTPVTSEPSPVPPGHSLRTLLTTGLRPEESNQSTETIETKPEASESDSVSIKPSSHSPHITRTVTGSLTRSSAKDKDIGGKS